MKQELLVYIYIYIYMYIYILIFPMIDDSVFLCFCRMN